MTAGDVAPPPPMDHPVRRHERYPAVDGLRAVAILLVILNHADVPGFSSGFVGVDIFFALSGFLITDRIVRSWDTGDSIALPTFWAARARRLLPAIVTVIAVTCLVSAIVLSPQELSRIAGYGLAADFFLVNNVVAYRGGNYFAGPLRELPFLHLWSLAVEEQFYLVWPIALGLGARWISRLTRLAYRRVVAIGLAVAVVASLAASVALTQASSLWAFYSLPTRVYEFALGAAAVLFWKDRLVSSALKSASAGLGTAAICAALVLTPDGPSFPSAWPLLSAGGTVLIILGTHAAGGGTSPATRLLGSSPLRFIGRYSFGWYLWHWPALVLGTAAWGVTSGRIASAASLVVAIAMFHWVEQPVRYLPSLVRSNRRSLVAGGLALTLGAVTCFGLAGFSRVRMRDPFIKDLARAEESFVIAGCTRDVSTFGESVCLGGSDDPTAPVVLLLGDSHAGQWAAAFSQAGREGGFRVAVRSLGNCTPYPVPPESDRYDDECAAFQRGSAALIADDRIRAVVAAEAMTSRLAFADPDAWYDEMARTVEGIDQPVALLVDNPSFRDPLRCLARGGSEAECRVSRADAFARLDEYAAVERRANAELGVELLDLNDMMCPGDPCPLRVDDVWVAARAGHVNRDFTLTQTDRIAGFVDALLQR